MKEGRYPYQQGERRADDLDPLRDGRVGHEVIHERWRHHGRVHQEQAFRYRFTVYRIGAGGELYQHIGNGNHRHRRNVVDYVKHYVIGQPEVQRELLGIRAYPADRSQEGGDIQEKGGEHYGKYQRDRTDGGKSADMYFTEHSLPRLYRTLSLHPGEGSRQEIQSNEEGACRHEQIAEIDQRSCRKGFRQRREGGIQHISAGKNPNHVDNQPSSGKSESQPAQLEAPQPSPVPQSGSPGYQMGLPCSTRTEPSGNRCSSVKRAVFSSNSEAMGISPAP